MKTTDNMAFSSPKTSYLLEYQATFPRLTNHMMKQIDIPVTEIVSTQDHARSVQYTYIHVQRHIRQEELSLALQSLASENGLHGGNMNGICFFITSSTKTSLLIENHPGFRMLVDHEVSGNPHFHRWVDEGKSSKGSFGYKRHKNKLGIPETINKGIYVLRVDNRPRPFFYVGKAEDIGQRIQQHSDGTGAYCITGEPFTHVEPVTKGIDYSYAWYSTLDQCDTQGTSTTWSRGSGMRC